MGSADASPVMRELVSRFADDPARVDAWTDSELYAEIVLAASVVAGGSPAGTWSDAAAERIGERMGAGWFAGVALTSPQLHHGPVPVVRVTNGDPRSVVGQKPRGALWTSSRLPDGSTGWSLLDHGREPVEVDFDPHEVRVHHLDGIKDYVRLVARHPRTVDGTAHVDWEAAATEFDAVHLTARGLLRIEGLVVDTPAGTACLTGWNAECTVWLRAPG
ncbi:hypothetical protein ACFWN2_30255 [Lentzea sp. NPDC058436]|uniref:hypothetical protein n=1 Tax=Lentzea sp. NPDC058436 TaxID=3346499 RepID=UPI003660E3E6